MEKRLIAAIRGRDKDNTNLGCQPNGNFKQTLEINRKGVSNTITTVLKDNLVIEILDGEKNKNSTSI